MIETSSNQFVSKSWLLLIVAAMLVYLASLSFSPYSIKPLVKALPIWCLIVVAARCCNSKAKTLLMLALAFSSLGDVFLATSYQLSFMLGLGSFFIAHVFYCIVFYRGLTQTTPFSLGSINKPLSALLIVYASIIGAIILPHTGELFVAVVFYFVVLTTMGIFAFSSSNFFIRFGALSFVVSDTILAFETFLQPPAYSEYLIMTTYYTAQLLLSLGIISNSAKSETG